MSVDSNPVSLIIQSQKFKVLHIDDKSSPLQGLFNGKLLVVSNLLIISRFENWFNANSFNKVIEVWYNSGNIMFCNVSFSNED